LQLVIAVIAAAGGLSALFLGQSTSPDSAKH